MHERGHVCDDDHAATAEDDDYGHVLAMQCAALR